jgi:uncharacterized protein with von Willebrand factor type A (vWA) domain
MKKVIYKKWDGTQQAFSLKRKDIVDKFMENIIKGMSPNMSMMRMLWDGFQLAGMDFRVMGLEEMLQEIEQHKADLFSRYNLEKAFDQPMDELKYLLDQETLTRNSRGASPAPSYDELPPGLLEKIKHLQNFDFSNTDSREMFARWHNRQGDIFELYEFYSQYAHKFTGDEDLNFEQALELMRQMKSLENLQQQIMSGQFQAIDAKDLQRLLGERAEKSFNILIQLPDMVSDEGVVEFSQKGYDMTPKGMRSLGELAFGKLYQHLKRDRQGKHSGNAPQTGEIEPDSSRPYQFGDRFDLDISKTIRNSLSKRFHLDKNLQLEPEDFYVREREQLITSTTVVLLDLSWSMSWYRRFESAKKVALALDHYVRTRFPKDKLHVVGFSTEARELKGNELALAVWDSVQPFTNLQGALRLAMKLIKKSANRNNRVIVITDGQPTAYYIGDELHVELPADMLGLSPNAAKATLAEVRKVTAQGMNIETFMLDNNPVLVEFTHAISKINGGRAVMCVPGELGELIRVEEIKRRGGRI